VAALQAVVKHHGFFMSDEIGGGVITNITAQVRNERRVNVFLDDAFAFGLARDAAHGLRIGQTLTPQDITALQARDDYEKTRERALNLLTYRPRSAAEVTRHLLRKGADPDHVAQAVAHLGDVGLLDDADFARYWIEQRNAFKPRSTYLLRRELFQKGVAPEIVDAALAEQDDDGAALLAGRKRAARWAQLPFDAFRLKLGRFLQGRGFSYAVARSVIETLWDELEEEREETEPEAAEWIDE
jgi:regulatory protein